MWEDITEKGEPLVIRPKYLLRKKKKNLNNNYELKFQAATTWLGRS